MSLSVVHLAFGIGAGEAALGAELARQVVLAGGRVFAVVDTPMNAAVMAAAGAEVYGPAALGDLPPGFDALVLSSSLTCGKLVDRLPRLPTLATEHTWLPRSYVPIDRYVVFMPEDVWVDGLKEGPYRIALAVQERCHAVGWAGDPPPDLGEPGDEVLVYLGQPGGIASPWDWRPHALAALERITCKDGIPVVVVGDACGLRLPPAFRWIPSLPPAEYARRVGRARLVVSHATAATMQIALLSGTPIVALTEGRAFRHLAVDAGWGDLDALTWARHGLIHHCPASPQAEAWIRYALSLPRPLRQPGGGERRALTVLEDLVR